MKFLLGAVLFLIVLAFVGFLMPAIIGIIIGIGLLHTGSPVGGIICIIGGIIINIGLLYGEFGDIGGYTGGSKGYYRDYEDCPYCGSGDTDGNHCYNCDDDF